MHKQTTRIKNTGRGLLRNDLERLKAVLAMMARDARGQAKHALYESYENMKDRTAGFHENVADYVGEKPYKALAIALFSGLAFGLAMHKKQRIRKSRQ